jgi:hypothetical protein
MAPLTRRLAPLAAVLIAAAGCTTTSSLSGFDEPDFAEVVAHYQTLQEPKLLALATEANGRFAWGIAAGEAAEADASAVALKRCRKAARSGGMRSQCLAFAVGDQPAPDTVEGCAARRITSRRCEMQRSYQGKL